LRKLRLLKQYLSIVQIRRMYNFGGVQVLIFFQSKVHTTWLKRVGRAKCTRKFQTGQGLFDMEETLESPNAKYNKDLLLESMPEFASHQGQCAKKEGSHRTILPDMCEGA
jgi:hypothetical protein